MKDLLSLFVSTDPSHQQLHEPFSVGNHSYATDGKILIRVPRQPDIPEKTEDIPPVGVIAIEPPECYIFSPLSAADVPAANEVPCDECFGTGQVGLCHECHGDGAVSFKSAYNGYAVPCKTCSGHGRVTEGHSVTTCEVCQGKKKTVDQSTLYEILPGKWIPLFLIDLVVRNLESVEVAPLNEYLVAIRFDGGDGCIGLCLPPELPA